MGSVTVWDVMLTVVIRCFGVIYDQELLNVSLKTQKHRKIGQISGTLVGKNTKIVGKRLRNIT